MTEILTVTDPVHQSASAASRLRVADAVCDALAESEAELLERVATLETELAVYRELAQEGIQRIAALTSELGSKQRQLAALREEFSHFRAMVMRRAEGVAA